MNFQRTLVLLLASINPAAGFAPACSSLKTQSLSRPTAFIPKIRFGSTLFSEVEATETSTDVTATASVEPAEPSAAVEAAATEAPTSETSVDVTASAESPAVVEAVAGEEAAGTEAETPEEEPKKSIYVANISFDCTESDLRVAFEAHGTVEKVTVPTDRVSGKARGFAFVQMSNDDETAAAIEAMNETPLGGRTIFVSESLPKGKVGEKKKRGGQRKEEREYTPRTKIYVGNLSFDTSEDTITSMFDEYGAVWDCFMPTDVDGNRRGFAFVTMDEGNAVKAIEGLRGVEVDGRTLSINKSVPKGEKSKPKNVKLYVGNLSWGTEEGALRELFEEYGKVVDCYLPLDSETGQHRGFAFVTMDPEDALRAADETDGYELDGRILRVNEAQPKGRARSYSDNQSYDGGDVYDEGKDESWGNDSY